MEFAFKNDLSPDEFANAETFFRSLSFSTIEQHPAWRQVLDDKNPVTWFIARDKDIRCFAVISERAYPLFKTARISFGPLFNDPDVLTESIIAIRKHYRDSGFSYLAIQLAMPTGSTADYVEYKVNKEFEVEYEFTRENWSSLIIDLTKPADDTFRSFSKGHKSAIKKAVTDGTVTRQLSTGTDVDQFAEIFVKMQSARSLNTEGLDATKALFTRIHNFLLKNDLGFFLGVYDKAGVMAGGIVVIYQGNTARYYKGASDPDRKDIAVLHLAIFEALKISAAAGRTTFDLWGYNHMVDEQDQVFFINRFKKGFSDNFLFYPKVMHISLKKGGYRMYKRLLWARNKLKR